MDVISIIKDTEFYIIAISVTFMTLVFDMLEGHTDKSQNRVFVGILVDVMISAVSSMLCVGLAPVRTVSDTYYDISYTAHMFYFISHTLLAPLFFVYVQRISGVIQKKNGFLSGVKGHIISFSPLIIAELFIILNPLNSWVYYYDENAEFHRNWAEGIIYIVSAIYLLLAIFSLLYYWYAINKRRRNSLIFSFAMVLFGILVQLINVNFQVELMFEAFALVGIMFVIEKEDDRIDAVLRTYNRGALRMDLNNYFRMKRNFSVICIRIMDTEFAKKAAFTTEPDVIMKPVAEYLRSVHSKYLIYRSSPESFMLLCEKPEELTHTISERFKSSFHYEGGDIILKYTMLFAKVPEDLVSEESVMLLSDEVIPSEYAGKTLSGKELILLTRSGKISEAIRRGISLHNFDIFYQPIYRLSDKKIEFAEASIKLTDEEIGIVDEVEFMPVAAKLGLAFQIYDYIFEEICIFLGSGIPVEMGLKGFAVTVPIYMCMKDSFIERIIEFMDKYDVPKGTIDLQLLESTAYEDYGKLVPTIERLKHSGFAVSIVGLGSGIFKFSRFFDTDFDIVNISLSQEVSELEDPAYEKVLEDSVSMIKELGKKVLIRGGKNAAHIEKIDKTGATYLQSEYYTEAVRQNEFISIIRMTEAARLEEQRAIAGSEAKSSFLANMSHEIRTPINAILGMNEMILRESEDDNILSYARDIESAGRSLVALINDILDFSKIEAGSMDISNASYNLAGLISDVCGMLRIRYADKNLDFKVNVSGDLPKRVFGDEMRIRQVLVNILNNAFKYTNVGGITLSVGSEGKNEDFKLIFSVKDTGIGIKEEDMEKLFGTFMRLDMDRNKTVEGSGLGLAITKNLVELMGGNVTVESTYGKGSTFKIILPQTIVDPTPIGDFDEGKKGEFPALKKKRDTFTAPKARILVVDDTPLNLKVISKLLNTTGIKVDTVLSGMECLSITDENKYDMIFLDFRMPEMDGVETLKRLREKEGGLNDDTPVIALTANALSGAKERFLADGFDDYLAKPVEAVYLEEMIIKYLPDDKVIMNDKDESEYDAGEDIDPSVLERFGVNTAKGEENCGGGEIYLEALNEFSKTSTEAMELVRGFMKEKDIENLTIRVHSLKSTSRLIGALELGDKAERLEKAGDDKNWDYINDNITSFLVDLRSICDEINKLIGDRFKSTEGEEELTDVSLIDQAFDALKEYAEAADFSGAELVLDTLAEYKLPKDIRDKVDRIREAIEGFMWEDVLNELG